jgi:hypothetical protein
MKAACRGGAGMVNSSATSSLECYLHVIPLRGSVADSLEYRIFLE